MKKFVQVIRMLCLATAFGSPVITRAGGFPIVTGPYTTTQVCPQTNPTAGVTAQCVSHDGTTLAQTTVNANAGGGTFSGTGLAKADAGTLGVSTNVTLNHYSAATNIFVPGENSAPNLARAQANWADVLNVQGVPSLYNLTFTFELDGDFTTNNPYFSSLLDVYTNVLQDGDTVLTQSSYLERSYYKNTPVTNRFSQTFTGLSSKDFEVNFGMLATTDIPVLNASQVATYQNVFLTGTGGANFANTMHFGTLSFTDANGNPLNNVSVSSANGYGYTVASSVVTPEPGSLLLLSTGLTGMAAAWHRRRIVIGG